MISTRQRCWMRKAQQAICAGAAAALVLGATPGMALASAGVGDTPVAGEYASPEYRAQTNASSRGDTKLYVIAKQDDLTTAEGTSNEQIKVSIPVAIHYVADSEGNLTGPSDNVVKFVNHTNLGAVHVSKIAVENRSGVSIVKPTELGTANDRMTLSVQPVQGQSNAEGTTFTAGTANEGNSTDYKEEGTLDQLGNYAGKTASEAINPVNKNDWNIAQKHGALALNKLTGKVNGFSSINPSSDYQVGTIHWTVRAGTRAQADTKDATVTIHYNANNGSNANCTPIPDQEVVVLDTSALPTRTAYADGLSTAVRVGEDVTTPPLNSIDSDGIETTYEFKKWSTTKDGSDEIETIGDLGSASDIAGKTFVLYAIYGAAS